MMTSVERVHEYAHLPREGQPRTELGDVKKTAVVGLAINSNLDSVESAMHVGWPSTGSLEFRDVTMCYDKPGDSIFSTEAEMRTSAKSLPIALPETAARAEAAQPALRGVTFKIENREKVVGRGTLARIYLFCIHHAYRRFC
jgi:hypothetical protein